MADELAIKKIADGEVPLRVGGGKGWVTEEAWILIRQLKIL